MTTRFSFLDAFELDSRMPGLCTAVLLVFVWLADLAVPPTLSTYKLHLQVSWTKSAQGRWELLWDWHNNVIRHLSQVYTLYQYACINSTWAWTAASIFQYFCDSWTIPSCVIPETNQQKQLSVSCQPSCQIMYESWAAAHLFHSASSILWARWGCGHKSRNPLAGSHTAPHAYTDPSGNEGSMDGFWSTWLFCPLNSEQGTWEIKC